MRLARSLLETKTDWAPFVSKFVFINDSPGHPGITEALSEFPWSEFGVECITIPNSENMGFVSSVNKGLHIARESGDHALLLNSDTVVFGSWLTGMLEVLDEDEKICFVSPRSNNATIATYPQPTGTYSNLDPAEAFRLFLERSTGLPRFTLVPLAVGFCLLIRSWVLRDLGELDEVYSPGYNEENDLIMRANRYGMVSATANRVFVYHDGEASFSQAPKGKNSLESRNRQIFTSRYPESAKALERFFSGPRYQTEFLWSQTGAAKPRITFDFTNIHSFENGTSKLSRSLLLHFTKLFAGKYRVTLYSTRSTSEYHELTNLDIELVDAGSTSIPFSDAIIRVGQVFSTDWILELRQKARHLSVFMLDPIAWDTQETAADFDPKSWNATFVLADQIPSISQFSQEAFANRFVNFKEHEPLVISPSLSSEDYLFAAKPASLHEKYVLVMGNKFRHKFVAETVKAVSRASAYPTYSIGGSKNIPGSDKAFVSGDLSAQEIQALIINAEAVVFPSVYEGFGFPLLEAVVNSKRIFARDMSVNRELSEKLGRPDRLRLYESTEDLVYEIQKLNSFNPVRGELGPIDHSWDRAAAQLEGAIDRELSKIRFEDLEERLTLAWLIGSRNHVGDPVTLMMSSAESSIRSLLRIRWVFRIGQLALNLFRFVRKKT